MENSKNNKVGTRSESSLDIGAFAVCTCHEGKGGYHKKRKAETNSHHTYRTKTSQEKQLEHL